MSYVSLACGGHVECHSTRSAGRSRVSMDRAAMNTSCNDHPHRKSQMPSTRDHGAWEILAGVMSVTLGKQKRDYDSLLFNKAGNFDQSTDQRRWKHWSWSSEIRIDFQGCRWRQYYLQGCRWILFFYLLPFAFVITQMQTEHHGNNQHRFRRTSWKAKTSWLIILVKK